LWTAYLKKDINALSQLENESIAFVFPFRNESLEMLHWVSKNSTSWKAQYLLALNYLGRSQWDKGVSLFKKLETLPKDPLFYFVRGVLYKKRGIQGHQSELQSAYKLDSKNWRYAFALAEDLFQSGDSTTALSIIKKTYKQNPKNYFAGMLLAQILSAEQEYDKSIALLQDLQILPYEHATEGRKIYTQAYLGSALQKINKDDSDAAVDQLKTALLWPEHLGVGKPFDPEERWVRFLMAYLHKEKKEIKPFEIELKQVTDYSLKQLSRPSKKHLLGIYALQQTQGEAAAQEFIAQLLDSKHGSSDTTKEVVQFYYENSSLDWNKSFVKKVAAFLD